MASQTVTLDKRGETTDGRNLRTAVTVRQHATSPGQTCQRLIFGADAELYDRARPSYPTKLIDDVLNLVGTPCRAVDVGCGTGKATVLLAERGVHGVGVEPDASMAALARLKLEQYTGWRVDITDFEDWEPNKSELPFDLVIAAESWHWVSRRQGARLAQRVLRPGGWLVAFGYEMVRQDGAMRRAIDDVYAKYAPGPSVSGMMKARGFDPVGASFGQVLKREYPGSHDYTASEWTDTLRTSSDHRMLPSDRLEPLLSEVTAAINYHGGTYRYHYICELWAVELQ